MVTGLLTSEMQDTGRVLTQKLDQSGLKVRAALWILDSQSQVWRLLFGIEEVDTLGPRKVYKKVRSAILAEHTLAGRLDLRDVSVESPNFRLFRLLHLALNTGPGISQVRLSRNSINGTFIEDALVYRLS